MSENKLPKIGITHGDINGISYEVIIKALSDNKILEICTPIVYGLAKAASYHRKYMDIPDFSFQFIKNSEQTSAKRPNLINLYEDEVKIELGTSTKTAGQMSERALYAAGRDLKSNHIHAIVTAPINKKNIQSDKFVFPGQTEFFEYYFGGSEHKSMMLLVAENLKVGFVTNHIPVNKVAESINQDLIYKKLEILNHSLKQDFAIDNPTIAVLALNPHGGDNELIGDEDSKTIQPAIELAFQNHINAFGPFPADGFFASGAYTKFDAVLAMYHDQGATPFKLLGQDGVNFTAGLPIVRTSPAHGTAYDIAGKNVASSQAMRNSIYLAIDILRNRERNK
ncbi:MAG: 4-hydroxythreonine-4-phosphate dehydrogenase PdxA [Bacteroidales bacterium]|nr:4-hydroxythreonine-4-phosphate dehydrogenase PdxA [Bacteroidales bacterium]